MSNNVLLPVAAAVIIIGAGAAGGYLIDRHHRMDTMQTAAMDTTMDTGPAPQIIPPSRRPPMKQAMKSAPSGIGGTGGQMAARAPAPPAPSTRGPLTDNAKVAMSGTVVAKKGSVMTLKDSTGAVRVVLHEDTPKPWDMGNTVSAMDTIPVGTSVTVYGTVRDTGAVPKVNADAIYQPSSHTLYYVNGDKTPPAQMNSQTFAARYTNVGPAPAFAPSKVVATR